MIITDKQIEDKKQADKENANWELLTTICKLKRVPITTVLSELIEDYLAENKDTVELIMEAKSLNKAQR